MARLELLLRVRTHFVLLHERVGLRLRVASSRQFLLDGERGVLVRALPSSRTRLRASSWAAGPVPVLHLVLRYRRARDNDRRRYLKFLLS